MSTKLLKKYIISFDHLLHVFFYCFLTMVLLGCRQKLGDMYITQPDFRGKVTVIYGHPEGLPVRYNGKRQVFDIPVNGILKSKGHPTEGFNYTSEFFRRIGGNKLEKLNLYMQPVATMPPTFMDLSKEVLFFAEIKGDENILLDGEVDTVKAFTYYVKGWDFGM